MAKSLLDELADDLTVVDAELHQHRTSIDNQARQRRTATVSARR